MEYTWKNYVGWTNAAFLDGLKPTNDLLPTGWFFIIIFSFGIAQTGMTPESLLGFLLDIAGGAVCTWFLVLLCMLAQRLWEVSRGK